MPAWREYGAVDLYLILDCTMWAKPPEHSTDDLCCYCYGGSDCTCNGRGTVQYTDSAAAGTVPLLVAP
jgi:hypothetical protein